MWSASELSVATGNGRRDPRCGCVPSSRGGNLQRDPRERELAGIAYGDQTAHGDLLSGGVEADVEIEAGEGDGLRSASSAEGASANLIAGSLRGRAGVGWPFASPVASIDRSKMTLPPGWAVFA